MNRAFFLLILTLFLAACTAKNSPTIAELRNQSVVIKAVPIEGGLEKAMAGYRRFIDETPSSQLSPEAIRRLADLKIKKEYGTTTASGTADRPKKMPLPTTTTSTAQPTTPADTEHDFEQRATTHEVLHPKAPRENLPLPGGDDLENAGAVEAVALYRKLLNDYPLYVHNDQVLYQLSRTYEELGRIEESMEVMNRLVRDYPTSRYIDDVQFRRGEYNFTRRRYLEAEDAYRGVVDIGVGSPFYSLALYKLGWSFYKQELYEASLQRFISLLDYKVSTGYNFTKTTDEIERKRTDNTFRVISLALSNLGGADAAANYFNANGKRSFEDNVYSNLAEYYYGKRRYSDAVDTYNDFVSRNPFHHKAPLFHMRVIDIYMAGGFPSRVIDAKKSFSAIYGIKGDYWQHDNLSSRTEVHDFLKSNLTDLANHHHALYRDERQSKERTTNFNAALRWYREFLDSFPQEVESPVIHYQMADLLLENLDFATAAVEYEKTAYDYPLHEKAPSAGYATVYAYRQHLATIATDDQLPIKLEVVRSSLKFTATFPEHVKAAVVLGAAVDDIYDMGNFKQAQTVAMQLIDAFPDTETSVLRDAWLIVAHSDFKLELFSEAETAYTQVLSLLPEKDNARTALIDNLAASIYKQGERARDQKNDRTAANHFLRVAVMAPTSQFRPTAEYDAAAALIRLEDWQQASSVLLAFRENLPGHELQSEVTKKIAYVYRQDGQLALAAAEFERVEKEVTDNEVRREALQIAAQLYRETGDIDRALMIYRRYVDNFPKPVEANLETRDKIARIFKTRHDRESYLNELRIIVAIDTAESAARTDRTRYLAGSAALVLAEVEYQAFAEVELVKPFKKNLTKKQQMMKSSVQGFTRLLDYEVAEITAAATFYLAEIYANLSKSLMTSERPDNLSPLELEQYELAIEDQAYPFEEKTIAVHQSNLELIRMGNYNLWVDRSLKKLAKFIPARYDRPEKTAGVLASLNRYRYRLKPNDSATNDISTADKAVTIDSLDAKNKNSAPAVTENAADSGDIDDVKSSTGKGE